MSNKTTLFLIGTLLLVGILGFVLPGDSPNKVTQFGLGAAHLIALYMLINNGTLRSTWFWFLILGCVLLALLGAMFKIMHWPYANMMLLAGLCSIGLAYLASFLRKPSKGIFDVLKLIWVWLNYGSMLLFLYRAITASVYYWTSIVSILLFWALVIHFSIQVFAGTEIENETE
jgi:hypothetical protein